MAYTSINDFTDEMLVNRYIELRDWVDQESKRLAAEAAQAVATQQKWMDGISSELHRRLLERKANSGSAGIGTFYRSQKMRLKVGNASEFLAYVFDNRASDLIVAGATKDGVRAYVEKETARIKAAMAAGIALTAEEMNVNPPGVEVTYVDDITVRRK